MVYIMAAIKKASVHKYKERNQASSHLNQGVFIMYIYIPLTFTVFKPSKLHVTCRKKKDRDMKVDGGRQQNFAI
jgi:hypothetical protein